MSWVEYVGPVAMAISIFLIQMVIRNNTRVAVLESNIRQSKEDIKSIRGEIANITENHRDNFAKIFESLEEIKIRLAHLDRDSK